MSDIEQVGRATLDLSPKRPRCLPREGSLSTNSWRAASKPKAESLVGQGSWPRLSGQGRILIVQDYRGYSPYRDVLAKNLLARSRERTSGTGQEREDITRCFLDAFMLFVTSCPSPFSSPI